MAPFEKEIKFEILEFKTPAQAVKKIWCLVSQICGDHPIVLMVAAKKTKSFTQVFHRKAVMEEVKNAAEENSSICLLATASLIGEGVDIPRLDTLILAMPISFKGRMVQYAGRLHRKWPEKKDVVIYDYLDTCSGLTVSMYRKRLQAYKSMGYQIHAPGNFSPANQGAQSSLF